MAVFQIPYFYWSVSRDIVVVKELNCCVKKKKKKSLKIHEQQVSKHGA